VVVAVELMDRLVHKAQEAHLVVEDLVETTQQAVAVAEQPRQAKEVIAL
jgi:hypothetical protein